MFQSLAATKANEYLKANLKFAVTAIATRDIYSRIMTETFELSEFETKEKFPI